MAGVVICLALTSPGGAQSVTLTLPQADAAAQQALKDNRPKLAYSLSRGLLQADPKNGQAHYYQALALAGMREFGEGRRSAARAYRHSTTNEQKYQAAQLAAKLSFDDDRLTHSQLWLRRSVQYAPSEVTRKQSVLAFQRVRHKNPLNFQLSFSMTPSDNVNNGANSPFNLINGVPDGGTLSTGALALSGLVTTAEINGSYRVAKGEKHETRLTGRLYTRRINLTESAPGVSGGDFSSSTLQAGVRHTTRSTREGVSWRFDFDGGRTWYGGDPLYDFVSLSARRSQRITKRLRLDLGAEIEQQYGQRSVKTETTAIKVFSNLRYTLSGGDGVGIYLAFRNADSDGLNRTSKQWSAIASYSLGKQIGPAKMRFSLGHSTLDYDNYSVFDPVTFSFIPVPGGRVDTSVFGSVTATFQDWGYMGFVPTLSLRAEKSRSNVSRFDVDEASVSFGIRSEF